MKKSSAGFTLIELIIVIAVLGVLASAVLIGIDPVDKIAQANDAKIQSDVRQIQAAMEIYSVNNNGSYTDQAGLVSVGELKSIIKDKSGSAYSYATVGNSATVAIWGTLSSKRYKNAGTFNGVATPALSTIWQWCSTRGKAEPLTATSCP